MEEKNVLEEQLEELLEEGAVDPEDALEIAMVAGLTARLDGDAQLLAEVVAWRDGPGKDLLVEAFSQLDVESILSDFDNVLDPDSEDELIEEAVWDIDELVCAGIWADQREAVAPLAAHADKMCRMMPDLFEMLKADGRDLVKRPTVGADFALYGFWFAILG